MSTQYAAALHSFSRPFKVAYPARYESRVGLCFDYIKAHWKKISMAAAIGMLAGFIAGVVSSRTGPLLTETVYASSPAPAANMVALKPMPPSGATSQVAQDELARLRAQNEKLQTMVAELEKETPTAHSRRGKVHHRRRGRAHA